MTTQQVAASGTFALGTRDPITVRRLGYGAMQLTGRGIWGDPPDHGGAIAVLREAVVLGVDFIDTADAYGPDVSENLIREALHPYDGIVIATKGGYTRQGPDRWVEVGRPEYLRQCVQMSLRRLRLDRIDLWQLHRIDPKVPADEQFGVMKEMQDEGLIRHLGLSEVSVAELRAAQEVLEIVTVQNLYNASARHSEALLDYCTDHDIGFIPWFPLGARSLAKDSGPLAPIAARVGCTPSQLALAWLLRRSPAMLPIPGTRSVEHVRENCAAASVTLDDEAYDAVSAIASV